jgi:hypothetical protein
MSTIYIILYRFDTGEAVCHKCEKQVCLHARAEERIYASLVSRWLQPTIVSGLTTYRETRPPHGEQCRQTHARLLVVHLVALGYRWSLVYSS